MVRAEFEAGMRKPIVPCPTDGRYRCPLDDKILTKDVHSLEQHALGISRVQTRKVDPHVRAEHLALYEFLVPKKKDAGAGP